MIPEDNLGQIYLCRNKGWFGWLVSKITRSPYNHVTIDIGNGETIGAEPRGAKIRPYSDFPDAVRSRFPLTPHQAEGIAAWARAREGVPYAFLDDAAIGVALLTRTHTPRWIERIVSSEKRFQCASLADAAYRHNGPQIWRDERPIGAVYPGSFAKVFADFGWLE